MQFDSIKCVAFDVVGTLLFADPPVHMAYHRIGRKFGSQLDAITIRKKFREVMASRDGGSAASNDILGDSITAAEIAAASDGHVTSEEAERQFWRDVVCDVLPDVADPSGCFEALFDYFAQPSAWGCFMDVDETLPILMERGFILMMASNFDARLHGVCEGHPVLRGITRRVVSSEIGHRKPSRQFFEALARMAGCAANEILMVGDHFEHDVQAALSCGLQAIHLDRSGTLGPPSISTLDELLERLG